MDQQIVPVTPTEEMLSVRVSPILRIGDPSTHRVQEWRAALWAGMLSAAPDIARVSPKVNLRGLTNKHRAFAAKLAQTIACSCGAGSDDRLVVHQPACESRLMYEIALAVGAFQPEPEVKK